MGEMSGWVDISEKKLRVPSSEWKRKF